MTVSLNGTTEVSSSTWTTNLEPAAIISVNIRQGTAANAPTLVLDNLTVNTIVAVPEPSSIALIGFIGTAGLVVANRRRRTKLMLA